MIGKGSRGMEVAEVIKKYKGIYFITYAGCGAILSKYVKNVKTVAYSDLGPEAILKLEVEDFPLIVAIDCLGNDIYRGASTSQFLSNEVLRSRIIILLMEAQEEYL